MSRHPYDPDQIDRRCVEAENEAAAELAEIQRRAALGMPPPPWVLVNALQDAVHPEGRRHPTAKAIRLRRAQPAEPPAPAQTTPT